MCHNYIQFIKLIENINYKILSITPTCYLKKNISTSKQLIDQNILL